jgi:excisionase family DNA binding protein
MLTHDTSPDYCDTLDPDSEPVVQVDSLPCAASPDALPHVARGKRPSELADAPVQPVFGKFVSVAQAAALLRVSSRRVRALISAGWLRADKDVSGCWRIRRSDLKAVSIRLPGRPRKSPNQ